MLNAHGDPTVLHINTSIQPTTTATPNMIFTHTANVLNGHIDPTFFHIFTKVQQHATLTSQFTVTYGPKTNMTLNAKYANFDMHISDNCHSLSVSYKLIAIHNVNRTTGIYTFHKMGICP